MPNVEELSAIVVDIAFGMHRDLGPGLLENAYELILSHKLNAVGIPVERQLPIDIKYDGLCIERAFRVDILVDKQLLIEVKSTDQTLPVHSKQVLTYLRLMNLPLGLVLNFGTPTFKEGVRRLVNNPKDFASSRLRANNKIVHSL
jgi:GxxExxY protein